MRKNRKKLVEELIQYVGTKKGEELKVQYDVDRLEEERKRNRLLFATTLILAIVAVSNFYLAYLNYEVKHNQSIYLNNESLTKNVKCDRLN